MRHFHSISEANGARVDVVEQVAKLARAEACTADRQIDTVRIERQDGLAVTVLELAYPVIADRFEGRARLRRVDDVCCIGPARGSENRREVHYWLAATGADAATAALAAEVGVSYTAYAAATNTFTAVSRLPICCWSATLRPAVASPLIAAGIVDGSIPGATLPSDLNGTPPSVAPSATRLAQLSTPADIVVTNSEINDQYVAKETPDQYASWEQQWVQMVLAAGAISIFEEPNRICEPGFDIPMTDEFVAQTRQLTATHGITLLPAYDASKLYPIWNLTTGLMSSDCVHPNQTG